MAVNIDTLRALDANKSYYIANSTGEIKEAAAFHQQPHGVGDKAVANDAKADKNALYDKLYDQISEVLNRERTNLRDEIDNNIEEQSKVFDNAQPKQKAEEVDDDLEPLNINQLTGYTDKNGDLTDKF